MSNQYLIAFNNLIIKFIDDLITTFPEENDFKVYKRGIQMLNSANSKKFCQLFKNYIFIYKDGIINKDETFFLTTNYSEVIKKKTDTLYNLINKLKGYWKSLSDSNKEKIWEYFHSLIKLSDLIM